MRIKKKHNKTNEHEQMSKHFLLQQFIDYIRNFNLKDIFYVIKNFAFFLLESPLKVYSSEKPAVFDGGAVYVYVLCEMLEF